MTFDLSIQGRVWGDGITEGWLYIQRGRIAKVSRHPLVETSAQVRLSGSQFLLPAATDLHVHLRDWAQSSKETVESGTMSALAGGVTTVADMPNTQPRVDSVQTVERRVGLLRAKSYVDFAIHSGPPESADTLAELKRVGAFAIKFYPAELRRLPALLGPARRANLKVVVHAEDDALVGTEKSHLAESAAIRKTLSEVGDRDDLRFAHVSTSEGAGEILAAKRERRTRLTTEVTPHHLYMSDELAAERIGEARRVNPALRSARNCARMRRLLKQDAFDFIATDHAPHTVQDKSKGAPGFPALEFALPLMLTKTKDVGLVTRMYCEAPARYLGIPKGRIAPGYAADLVVIGRRKWKLDPDRFVSKGRVTPFAGETLAFSVDQVFMRGSTAYEHGRFARRQTPRLVTHEQIH